MNVTITNGLFLIYEKLINISSVWNCVDDYNYRPTTMTMTMTMNLNQMLHPSLRQIERTHASIDCVICRPFDMYRALVLAFCMSAWQHTYNSNVFFFFLLLYFLLLLFYHLNMLYILCILQELYLHGNRLTHLRQCDRYLPVSIQTLTLDHNNITDLNEICTLSGLTSLNSISIQENPCVQMTNSP